MSQLEVEKKRRVEEHRALLKHEDALKINELREINEHAEKMARLEIIAQGKSLAFDKIERAPNERCDPHEYTVRVAALLVLVIVGEQIEICLVAVCATLLP